MKFSNFIISRYILSKENDIKTLFEQSLNFHKLQTMISAQKQNRKGLPFRFLLQVSYLLLFFLALRIARMRFISL